MANNILENIRIEIESLSPSDPIPTLAVILVGDNPASESYIRMKERRAREIGMNFRLFRYRSDISQDQLEAEVSKISGDTSIHGLIIQAPLPDHIDRYAVNECIDESKDVDGFTKAQIGNMFLGHDGLWSCTPKGIMTLLTHYDISVSGKQVLVIGRSNIVGKPMSLMLINAGATVTTANSKTPNLRELTRQANIIIVAAGRPHLLTRDMVTPESIIIDVGCTFVDGVACGDVDREDIEPYVRAVSPVPGGVGPMTVATLVENTWKAYKKQYL